MAPCPLHVATGGMSYTEFLKLSRRWMLFGQNGLPFEFTKPMWLRGVEFWVSMAALVLATVTGHWLAALAPAATLLVFEASMLLINRRFGGAPVPLRYLWAVFALPVVAPAQLAYGLVDKRVEWRGCAYDLRRARSPRLILSSPSWTKPRARCATVPRRRRWRTSPTG